jgi:hypothetical protein
MGRAQGFEVEMANTRFIGREWRDDNDGAVLGWSGSLLTGKVLKSWYTGRYLHNIAPRVKDIKDPSLTQLLAYEVAKITLAYPFNRFA